jgi:hypothetical protein
MFACYAITARVRAHLGGMSLHLVLGSPANA